MSGVRAAGRALDPDDPVGELLGVGPRTRTALAAAGVRTVGELLALLPRRVEEVEVLFAPHADAVGRRVRLQGLVVNVCRRWLPGGARRCLVVARLRCADGVEVAARFFNRPYLANVLHVGECRVVEGRLVRERGRYALVSPRLPGSGEDAERPVRLRYPEIEGISGGRLRRLIAQALDRLAPGAPPFGPFAPLPAGLNEESWTPRRALEAVHRPRDVAEHERARRWLALGEAVGIFRRIERARRLRCSRRGPRVAFSPVLEERLDMRMGLDWTRDQRAAIAAIRCELSSGAPMGLLLQGDVGTGKTAVAAWAALAVLASGHQVAFLAPTELLAHQHRASLARRLAGSRVRVSLFTATQAPAVRDAVRRSLAAGEPQLVFGTHALLSEHTVFARLGLVVIDEQHRFGVTQRMQLVRKAEAPHVLVMTATPIPRTLALALFGDLDVAVLRDRPCGRPPPPAVRCAPEEVDRVEALISRRVRRGGRVLVVCPAVGEGGREDGAVRWHARLARRFACGLVHGRMAPEVCEEAVAALRRGEIDVLVGTTVLEVGVDVPEATLVVVVGAERFGLATLHQLRGRAGRGRRRGLCVLLGPPTPRLEAVCKTADGFELAERDLALRGPGELLGRRQSGAGDLRALDPTADLGLLLRARAAVRAEEAGRGE